MYQYMNEYFHKHILNEQSICKSCSRLTVLVVCFGMISNDFYRMQWDGSLVLKILTAASTSLM